MNKKSIILCEGETDQIILSYYLIKKFGYSYIGNGERKRLINPKNKGESICVYKNATNELDIWAVGSESLLHEGLNRVLRDNSINADTVYARIAIVSDYDTEEENKNRLCKFTEVLKKYTSESNLVQNTWMTVKQNIGFDEEIEIKIINITIPTGSDGSLETMLLTALSEDTIDKILVEKSYEFVESIKKEESLLKKYLNHRRLLTKAPLSAFFAIANPERTFTAFDTMLSSIDWDTFNAVQENLLNLDELNTALPAS